MQFHTSASTGIESIGAESPRPSLMPGLVLLAAMLAIFWLGVGIAIGFAWGAP